MSKAVAEYKDVLKEIETEIEYRFDYDNDALILTFLGRKIDGETFENILAKHSNGKYKPREIKKMSLESGYLQFTFPQNYESLDYESEMVLAVPIYSYIEEGVTEYLESIDKDGNIVELSAKEMPDVPVIVVGRSERVDADGNLRVGERSVIIPKESRMHYNEAIKKSREVLKSAKINNHIVKILSQDDFDNLTVVNNTEQAVDQAASLKSVSVADPTLTVTTNNPKTMELTISPYSNGTNTSNKYEIYSGSNLLKTVNTSGLHTYVVDEANHSYTFQIKYYYWNTFLGCSNTYTIQSSHRRSGGVEVLDYLYASHASVVALEGWWVSELEIAWDIYLSNFDGTTPHVSSNGSGGTRFECASDGKTWLGTTKYISPRYVSSEQDENLFEWFRSDGPAYTVAFRETDEEDQTEQWEISINIVAKVIDVLAADNPVVIGITEVVKKPIIKLITVLKKDKDIGSVCVNWSTPDDFIHPVKSTDFKVKIKQN